MLKEILSNIVQEKYVADIILDYKNDIELFENQSLYFLNEIIYIFKCYNYILHFLKNENIDLNNVIVKKYNDTIYFSYLYNSYIYNIFFQICDLTCNKCLNCNKNFKFFDKNLFNFKYLDSFNKWFDNLKFCNQKCKLDLTNYMIDYDISYLFNNHTYYKITQDFEDHLLLNKELKIFLYVLE